MKHGQILVASLLLAAGMVGCQSSDSGTVSQGQTTPGFWGDRRGTSEPAAAVTEAPAPKVVAKPAEKPATPAPAPAARPAAIAGDGWARTMMYLPTGAAASSTILVERMMPAEVVAGQNFDYIFKVTNLTQNAVSNVVLRDECEPKLNVVSSNPAFVGAAPTLTWNLGDLAAGQSKTVTVTAKAAQTGTVGSCVNVTWAQTLCQQVVVVQPALKVELAQTPEATPCQQVCAKVTITNTGTGIAKNAKATYTLPAGWTTTDGKTGAITLSAGDLAAGQSKTFDVCGKAAKAGAQQCGTVTGAADGGLTASGNQACTTIRQPVLAIKAECPGKTLQGRNLTFKFTVTNKGDAACDPTISAPIPATTTLVSADNNGATSGGGVTWKIGSLAPNASKTLTMVVKSGVAGSISASAVAICDCSPQASDQCTTSTEGVPDIGTGISDDTGVVQIGNNHVFRYTVKNQGQINLINVKLVATLDAGLQFKSSTSASAAAVNGQKVEWKIGTLAVGQTLTFDIVATGTKSGELVIQTETTSDQTRLVRNDEQVNYVEP